MQIFAVIAPEPNQLLKDAIIAQFPDRYYEAAPGQFFVSEAKATTQQISEKIGLPGGKLGRAMVLHIINWNGWHDKNIWEWLTTQNSGQPNLGSLGG